MASLRNINEIVNVVGNVNNTVVVEKSWKRLLVLKSQVKTQVKNMKCMAYSKGN